jgi:hypothetical protein
MRPFSFDMDSNHEFHEADEPIFLRNLFGVFFNVIVGLQI